MTFQRNNNKKTNRYEFELQNRLWTLQNVHKCKDYLFCERNSNSSHRFSFDIFQANDKKDIIPNDLVQ